MEAHIRQAASREVDAERYPRAFTLSRDAKLFNYPLTAGLMSCQARRELQDIRAGHVQSLQ